MLLSSILSLRWHSGFYFSIIIIAQHPHDTIFVSDQFLSVNHLGFNSILISKHKLVKMC